jgi:hypothetical protein
MVKTGAVSSTVLRLEPTGWKVVSWGQPQLIKDLTQLRDGLASDARAAGRNPDEIFATEVPIAGVWMTGYLDSSNAPVLATAVNILFPKNSTTNHLVSPDEMLTLANRARAYRGGSN